MDFSLADWAVVGTLPLAAYFSWKGGFRAGCWSSLMALRDQGCLTRECQDEMGLDKIPKK